MAGVLWRLVMHLTRFLEVKLRWEDPAQLGMATGFVHSLLLACGFRRYRWVPDFVPGPTRLELRWTVGFSLVGLGIWFLRELVANAGKRRKPLLPSPV